MATTTETYLSGPNLPYIEAMYRRYLADPASVDSSWLRAFEEMNGDRRLQAEGPTFKPRSIFHAVSVADTPPRVVAAGSLQGRVEDLIEAFRLYGHLVADIDPLGVPRLHQQASLDVGAYGFSQVELETPVQTNGLFEAEWVPLSRVIERLKKTYAGHIGVEFKHIPDPERRGWLQKRLEHSENRTPFDAETKLHILAKLCHTDTLEQFLHTKYLGAKRFSIHGGEALIPLLDQILEAGGQAGVEEVVMGMAHRGRLITLASILGKSLEDVLSEFEKNPDPWSTLGSGDVKYHQGYSSDHVTRAGDTLHLTLAFNPSHLEAVDPVVLGMVRAKQDQAGDVERTRILPVLMHGDAAFAGQGIVQETLNMQAVTGYRAGGTIHVVINNQIGFTTFPHESRSTTYATDVAKMVDAPIFHVNGDDPEAVAHVAWLALAYRQRFQQDVVVDFVCFRRYGHNEADEPRYTQPMMYRLIDRHPSVRETYAEQLIRERLISQAEADTLIQGYVEAFSRALEATRAQPRAKKSSPLGDKWAGYLGGPENEVPEAPTAVARDRLVKILERLAHVPAGFQPHRTITRFLSERQAMAQGEKKLDWGAAEAIAFGSLLWEGTPIRLSGQDAGRGTFTHRHAILSDMATGETHVSLAHLAPGQGRFEVYNSLLSEAGVLGFDYGYSLDSPHALVLWEAQFGDFANNAQVIIDQFISSAEDKWDRLSGLVLLLPHGYEGQGPEHSSARLERFLQLAAEDNLQICNLTTPAQYFHVLRRQVVRKWRKPLVILSPKSLLRHKEAVSSLTELAEGQFHRVLPETRAEVKAEAVRRIILCSGKVFYDLAQEAQKRGAHDVAVVRVEQLYPFPEAELRALVGQYPASAEVMWVQEEPENMGAWSFMFPRLLKLSSSSPLLAARAASASPATGSMESFVLEQELLMKAAFAPREV